MIYQWDATQDNMKLTLDRDLYGLHMPMRRLMERKIVTDVSRHVFMDASVLPIFIFVKQPHKFIAPQSNLHLDILMGRDESIDFADVFLGKVLLLGNNHF